VLYASPFSKVDSLLFFFIVLPFLEVILKTPKDLSPTSFLMPNPDRLLEGPFLRRFSFLYLLWLRVRSAPAASIFD